MKREIHLSTANSILLDIIRIFAAQMVLLGHSFACYRVTIFQNTDCFMDIGSLGVVILFHLSGFLSIFSLEKNRHHEDFLFKEYIIQRIKRIYKGLIPALVFIVLIDLFNININGERYLFENGFTVGNFIGNLFMLHNHPLFYGKIIPFGSGRPLWTLSVEWWQYMLLGSVFFALAKKRKINLSEIIIYSLLSITGVLNFVKFNNVSICFLFGIFAFYLYSKLEINCNIFHIVFGIGTLILCGGILKEAYSIYVYIIVFIIFILFLLYGSDKNWKESKSISFMARYTYMLYLTHYSIIEFISKLDIRINVEIKLWGGVIICNVIAAILYVIFEKGNWLDLLKVGKYK